MQVGENNALLVLRTEKAKCVVEAEGEVSKGTNDVILAKRAQGAA
jgi:hypothetical protein